MSVPSVRTPKKSTAVRDVGSIPVTMSEHDGARTFLLLHGGGGPTTMTAFADLLAARKHTRVLLPTHPGFAGTSRPDGLVGADALARLYADLLEQLDLSDVTVIGSSFGGWVAAELALLGSHRVSGAVLVDAIGIEVADHPMAQVAGLSPAELARLAFHDPAMSPAADTTAPGPDIAALVAYAGPTMSDPGLLERLGKIDLPVAVVWGESDGIVDVAYGRAYAQAVPHAAFLTLPATGHLATVESPEQLLTLLWGLGSD